MSKRLLLTVLIALALGGCDRNSSDTPPSFALSGNVTSAIGVTVDGDVNDASAPFKTNDTPSTAQPLPNPVLVGGFVSRIGVGHGKFAEQGDSTDVYQATLAKGQAITLFISDHDPTDPYAIDLDIEIYNTAEINIDTRPVAYSISSTSSTETIRIPDSGSYYIFVRSIRGASNYLLTIGQPATLAAQEQPPFVAGEIIVRFRENDDPMSAASAPELLAASTGLIPKQGAPGQPILFSLGDAIQRQHIRQALGIRMASVNDQESAIEQLKRETIETVKALRLRPDIETADLNYIRRAAAIPNDEHYPLQWNLPLINLPQAWEVTTLPNGNAKQVIVAVVDTGVFLAHPDLEANLLDSGYDFISNPSIAGDGDGIDDNPDDPGDNATPGGSSFHGTHVAGTIAALANNGTGVTGISWGTNTRIMPIRVLGRGGGTTYDIIQGIRYAAGLSNDSGTVPPQRADIINLSLGGPGFSMTEQAEYNAVREAGVIVVAAAGNDNSNLPSYPAAYDGVISVSAVTMGQQRAPYSNFGPTVDIAAPGGNTAVDSDGDGYFDGVLSTLVDDTSATRKPVYSFAQGTSMATPHVAGVAAIMKSLDPGLDPDRFTTLLETGKLTIDLGATGRDDLFGYGLLDALKAVENINISLPPVLAIDHTGPLDFGPFINQLTFSTRNAGGGEFSITAVTDDADWLVVDPPSIDGSEGTFTVTVDRTLLVEGVYRATIVLQTDTTASLSIPVTLQVGQPHEKGNTGHLYFILVEPDTLKTIRTTQADNLNGSYRYRFDQVPAGRYFVVAGTDLDDDGEICDPGEACGGYPTIERLQPIEVQGEKDGINFGTNFDIILQALSEGKPTSSRPSFSRIAHD